MNQAGRAEALEPFGEGHPIEGGRVQRRLVRHAGAAERLQVGADAGGDRAEGLEHGGLAVALVLEEPHLAGDASVAGGEVVDLELEFLGERVDGEVPGVDQFAAELGHLAVGEMIPEREAPPPEPLLRLEDLDRAPRPGAAGRRP